METITLLDKTFRPYIRGKELHAHVQQLAHALNAHYGALSLNPPVALLPVLTGALRFVGELLPLLRFSYTLHPLKVSSYGNRTESNGTPLLELVPDSAMANRHVLLLEDIVETGHTQRLLFNWLVNQQAADIRLCTLLFEEQAFRTRNQVIYRLRTGWGVPCPVHLWWDLGWIMPARVVI